MRKGNAPFVFIACVVALLAPLGCGGDEGSKAPAAGGAGESGAGDSSVGAGGANVRFDGGPAGHGGSGSGEGVGGTRFIVDAQAPRDTFDPNCPPTMPMDNDPCAAATTCAYLGGGCTCQHEGHSDAGRTWHCQEFPQRDGGNVMCAAGTADGTGCEMQGRFCSTGTQTCGCFGTNSANRQWTCF